jgi:prepilin-type N-terminal cleavage/methylation domain-containing protein
MTAERKSQVNIGRGRGAAFTLIELLVVLAIIGLILALSIPNFRGMGEGTAMSGAVRQMMNDLAFARQQAIATRSTVAVVFLSPDVQALDPNTFPGQEDHRGHRTYLTEWRTLPEKIFIAESMFTESAPPFGTGFFVNKFPFPAVTNGAIDLPYIAFNPQGQCVRIVDSATGSWSADGDITDHVKLARGSILYARDSSGALTSFNVQEVPPNNSITSSNVIRIDWLTGRAEYVRADVQLQ